MTPRTIKTATAPDEASVIDVMVLAFSADPVMRWLYPDPHHYLLHFPSFVRAYGGKAFAYESAYYVDGYAGAESWLPPGIYQDGEALIALLQRTVSARDQETLPVILDQLERYHPSEPHWYLPMIGVDPTHQSQGYGSALLQHALLPCDRDHTPAYLESSNPRNIPLYQRHGFEVLGTIQVGSSPPVSPMLRKPR